MSNQPDLFRIISTRTSKAVGSPAAFFIALLVIFLWAVTGPFFNFSNTWQLVINTGTTIITFLMVFMIQNTQNRDAKAMQLKLDELLYSQKGARNSLVNLEEMEDGELEMLQDEFRTLHEKYAKALASRRAKQATK